MPAVAIVTGAGPGIGEAIAANLAKASRGGQSKRDHDWNRTVVLGR